MKTIFILDLRVTTWYIDYDIISDTYKVSQDEKIRRTFKYEGDALVYIMEITASNLAKRITYEPCRPI
jgi:hypothetical protein